MTNKTFKAGVTLGALGGAIVGMMLALLMYPLVLLALADKL